MRKKRMEEIQEKQERKESVEVRKAAASFPQPIVLNDLIFR